MCMVACCYCLCFVSMYFVCVCECECSAFGSVLWVIEYHGAGLVVCAEYPCLPIICTGGDARHKRGKEREGDTRGQEAQERKKEGKERASSEDAQKCDWGPGDVQKVTDGWDVDAAPAGRNARRGGILLPPSYGTGP